MRDEVIKNFLTTQMIFPRIKGSYMQCGPHVHNLIKDIKVQIATSIYTHKHICEKLG
jgi:hypothetical protein